jgi:hypothetical protein
VEEELLSLSPSSAERSPDNKRGIWEMYMKYG